MPTISVSPQAVENPSLGWSSSPVTRQLNTLEVFYKVLADNIVAGDRENWAISLALRLQFPPSIEDPILYVRRTWLLLRRLHPHLAAEVSTSESGDAHSVTIADLDADKWLAETFTDHSQDGIQNSTALLSTFRRTPTATCHWLPASQEVHIRCSHWRIDGVGSMMLGHSFMTALVSVLRLGLDADLESYESSVAHGSLTPSIEDLLGSCTDEEKTPASLREGAGQLIADFAKGVPSIGLPTRKGSESAAPGATSREKVTLDEATTASVTAACNKRGFSVSSAVHAALISVTASYPQHPMAKSYAAFFPTDTRRYFPSPWNSPEFAVGTFCSALPICITDVGNKDFDTVVRELSVVYSRDLTRAVVKPDGEALSMFDMIAPFARRCVQAVCTPAPPEFPPAQNPDMSNLGVAEKHIEREYAFGESSEDKIEVASIWVGVEVLLRWIQTYVWTFRDQLTVEACYNQSFYEREFILEVLDKVKAALLAGLDIEP
ncbi:hypothetical protein ACJ41O_012961 [Fusarium nematophilum]